MLSIFNFDLRRINYFALNFWLINEEESLSVVADLTLFILFILCFILYFSLFIIDKSSLQQFLFALQNSLIQYLHPFFGDIWLKFLILRKTQIIGFKSFFKSPNFIQIFILIWFHPIVNQVLFRYFLFCFIFIYSNLMWIF